MTIPISMALADGIVKEYGMHRLANVIIAAEREGKVTHSSTDMRTGRFLRIHPVARIKSTA